MSWTRMLLVAVLAVAACVGADRGLTGPEAPEMEAPMPSFAYSFTGCLNWSCTTGDCQNDPVVWGACCTEVDPDPEAPGIPRPSCGESPTYCSQYPLRCVDDNGPQPGVAPSYCFYANVGSSADPPNTSMCSDNSYVVSEEDPFDYRCNGSGILYDFPECFPQSGLN